jgi:hypothetical protein
LGDRLVQPFGGQALAKLELRIDRKKKPSSWLMIPNRHSDNETAASA